MLNILYQILGFRWCAAIMIEHDGVNDQIQLQLHNDLRHSPAWRMSSAYALRLTDAQLGYLIRKFDKAYKCGEDTACNFNQTNVKCPAYDTTKCSVGYNDGFYSTNSSHFNDYWFGTTPDLVRWFPFYHLLIRRSFYLILRSVFQLNGTWPPPPVSIQ